MAIEYDVDTEQQLIRVRVSGEVTVENSREFMTRLAEDPRELTRMDRLIEVGELDGLPDAGALRSMAADTFLAEADSGGARRAIVVKSHVVFGLARIFEALTANGGAVYRVFRDRRAALRWLRPH